MPANENGPRQRMPGYQEDSMTRNDDARGADKSLNGGRRTVLKSMASVPLMFSMMGPATAEEEQQPSDAIYVKHAFEEHAVDLGEVVMNYATTGSAAKPALLLIPGQTESWWGFEQAMATLASDFQVFAVDLRGQGRSTRTPGRYTFDNMGNDLVRFANQVIKRPVVTSGCSSGGVLSAWLSAYAPPGMVRGSHYEDAPLFASEMAPAYGPGIRQAAGPRFALMSRYLGDQWSVGDWAGYQAASRGERAFADRGRIIGDEAPQNMKEYDPEWARAFWEGTVAKSCDHERMLKRVKAPVLFTHHARRIDPASGNLIGAISDLQAMKVKEIVENAGQPFEYVSLPDAAHAMHRADPDTFVRVLRQWALKLPA
jgi:pimeloyl-ACP methyl ester carboxylesterase